MRVLTIIFAALAFAIGAEGQIQKKDSCSVNSGYFLKEQIVPATLVMTALVLNSGDTKKEIQKFFPNTNTHVDDWLKFGPALEMYAFDLGGLTHRNPVFNQTKYLLISHAATGAIVQILKVVTGIRRPSGGMHSFPSGHTSLSFVEATALYHEFKDNYPVVASSGFAIASATGFLRITNDAHWLPDVLAGAGIGIFVTNLIYKLEPLKNWQLFTSKKNVQVIPLINNQELIVRITL